MVDPLGSQFAHNSPYSFQENKLGKGVELEGAELKEFYKGVLDAVFENSAPVATQYVKTNGNSSYNSGAKAGHYLSIALGGLQIGVGLSGDVAAGAAELSTGGLATPAAVPLATTSTALIMNGGATIVKAVGNLNSEGKSGGRGSNHQKPDPNAQGDHSTFRTDPNSGKTTNTATYKQNSKNPKTGFDETKRVDVVGASHRHSKTGQEIKTPHTHLPKQKDPIPSTKEELPRQ